jgi:hypothetical protein
MNLITNYYNWNFNCIIISKLILKPTAIPRIIKLRIFFIITIKQYKKNLLLFYVIISLIFNGKLVLKTILESGLRIFNFKLQGKSIKFFLLLFINIYMPLINKPKHIIKKAILFPSIQNIFIYRINYFNFPAIYELNTLYLSCDNINNFIYNYRLQMDIYIKAFTIINNTLHFMLRMYRLPIIISKKLVN